MSEEAVMSTENMVSVKPFAYYAQLLEKLQTQLQQHGPTGLANWLSMARAREQLHWDKAGNYRDSDDATAKAIASTVKHLLWLVAHISYYAQMLETLLPAIEAFNAGQAQGTAVETLLKQPTIKPLQKCLGIKTSLQLSQGDTVAEDKLASILAYAPTADELVRTKHAIYALMALHFEQQETQWQLDVQRTGCLRLLQLAFNQAYYLYQPSKNSLDDEIALRTQWLGGRLHSAEVIENVHVDATGEGIQPFTLLELAYAEEGDKDVREVQHILDHLDYPQGSLSGRLQSFQQVNALPVSGELDEITLNQLMHIDSQAQTMRRAKAYGEGSL